LAALIVGVQAAQSSVIQVGRRLNSILLRTNWIIAIVAVVFTVIGQSIELAPVATAVLSTMSGSFLGLLLGQSALLVLTGKGGAAFQSFQALRSLGLVIAACLATVVDRVLPGQGPLTATLAVAALSSYQPRVGRRRVGYLEPNLLTKGTGLAVALGLVASLFYRNDVNWVRTTVSATEDFTLWHYALVVYGAVQGVVGFLVVQIIFADRQKWRIRVIGWIERFSIIIALSWLTALGLSIPLLPGLPIVPSVLGCSLLAALVGLISGFAHILELSWAPYLAGVVGASVLSLLLVGGIDPRLAMVLESSVIGSITVFFILLFRRRTCTSYK
jgi:hypothetical protein